MELIFFKACDGLIFYSQSEFESILEIIEHYMNKRRDYLKSGSLKLVFDALKVYRGENEPYVQLDVRTFLQFTNPYLKLRLYEALGNLVDSSVGHESVQLVSISSASFD